MVEAWTGDFMTIIDRNIQNKMITTSKARAPWMMEAVMRQRRKEAKHKKVKRSIKGLDKVQERKR